MESISKFNKGIQFLLWDIGIVSKYAWVIPLTDKKGIAITNVFKNVLKESNRKPNKKWVDKGSEFCKRSMKSFLQNDNIEINSAHNEVKSFVPEILIRTWKNKIYKYMTLIPKSNYIDKLEQLKQLEQLEQLKWNRLI